jgi:hypothetical protein
MRITKGGLLALGALMLIGANDLEAQAQTGDATTAALRRGIDVETIMSLRERLALTEDQITTLDAIRREAVERRSAQMAEMAEMRSRLRAGQIRPSEMMAFAEELRDANEGVGEARRERIAGVLDETQLEALQTLRVRGTARGRAGMRGQRGSAFGPDGGRGVPGRGFRGERRRGDGFGRGFRGARGPGETLDGRGSVPR